MTRRRSPRLHPQIHTTTEEAAGMALRRSPRLHPQIPASEEGAAVPRRRSSRLNPQIRVGEHGTGATGRRSTRLHPQVHAIEKGAGVTRRRRRRGTSPGTPASLPDNDDMLREILVRLRPQPSSLPRASAVCKRWQRVTTDPRFLTTASRPSSASLREMATTSCSLPSWTLPTASLPSASTYDITSAASGSSTCSGAATVASSSSPGTLSLCWTPSPASIAASKLHHCSQGYTSSMGLCSALPPTHATRTAAATRAPLLSS
ncbi:hypothetical protein ACQJBY_020902 [Aegilops geniculata]